MSPSEIRPSELLERARRVLRTSTRSATDATLTLEEARAIFDELQRLQQSNDRLRRQNKRARRRLAEATGEDVPAEDLIEEVAERTDTGTGGPDPVEPTVGDGG